MNTYNNYYRYPIRNMPEHIYLNNNHYQTENPHLTHTNLYSPYEGFIHGTMFKSLYDPYKVSKPYKIEPMNEQAEMLTKYDSLCFAKIDLNLYLDNHPENTQVLDLYNRYKTEADQVKSMYESKYGPLTLDSDFITTWSWNKDPWPWQN